MQLDDSLLIMVCIHENRSFRPLLIVTRAVGAQQCSLVST